MWSIGSSPIPRTAAEEAYFSHWLGIGIRCWRTEAGLLIYHNSNKQSNICKPHAFGVRSTRPGPVTLTCCSMGGISSPNGRTLTTMFQYLPTVTGESNRASKSSAPGELAAAAGAVSPKLDNDVPLRHDMDWPTHSPRTSHIWPDLRYVPGFLISVNRFCPTGPFIMLALDRLQPNSPDRFLSLHDSQRCPSSLHLNASTSNVSAQCWTPSKHFC